MKKTDMRQKIASKHRAAIKRFMANHGLKVTPWCISAGITEGALRSFLNGTNDSMGANNLELLAMSANASVAELLGEEIHYKVDDTLMKESANAMRIAAKARGKKLDRAEEMAYTVRLYNHAIEYHRKGFKDVKPNVAMADTILDESLAS